jgi:hypothetical protein
MYATRYAGENKKTVSDPINEAQGHYMIRIAANGFTVADKNTRGNIYTLTPYKHDANNQLTI